MTKRKQISNRARMKVMLRDQITCTNCSKVADDIIYRYGKIIVVENPSGRDVLDDEDFGRDLIPFHFDHILPFSKGGDDTVDNIQLLCAKCNLHKGNSTKY